MAFTLALGWSSNHASAVGRRLAIGLLPTIGLSIYLTYSRGALVGAAVGLGVLLVLSGEPKEVLANAVIGAMASVAAILLARTQPEIANASGGAGGGMVGAVLVALGVMCAAFSDALARRRIALTPWRRGSLVAVAVGAAIARGRRPSPSARAPDGAGDGHTGDPPGTERQQPGEPLCEPLGRALHHLAAGAPRVRDRPAARHRPGHVRVLVELARRPADHPRRAFALPPGALRARDPGLRRDRGDRLRPVRGFASCNAATASHDRRRRGARGGLRGLLRPGRR